MQSLMCNQGVYKPLIHPLVQIISVLPKTDSHLRWSTIAMLATFALTLIVTQCGAFTPYRACR